MWKNIDYETFWFEYYIAFFPLNEMWDPLLNPSA